MSTHNIGFFEELTTIIFELSSNIIKYAPYFFCCNNEDFKKLCNFQQPAPGDFMLFTCTCNYKVKTHYSTNSSFCTIADMLL